jgi:tRNA threonylcarbamoyladenosine biosynthesis protein TsaB
MAVMEDEQLVGALSVRDTRGPAEQLLVLMSRFLEQLGLTVWDVAAFAVGIGPGSWTGTRVGVTTGKVLAFATGKPISGISSFDATVYGSGIQEGAVCVLSDFGRDRVFCATYEINDGMLKRITEYKTVDLEAVIKSITKRTAFVGKGAIRHRHVLSTLGDLAILPYVTLPTAQAVALLGLRSLEAGESDDPFTLTPLYGAPPHAGL